MLNLRCDAVQFSGQLVREDYLQLRKEATTLQEYSREEFDHLTRYLTSLAETQKDMETENVDLKTEVSGLKQALKHANDQCVLLFNEVQKAWKASFVLQSDLKVCELLLWKPEFHAFYGLMHYGHLSPN